MGRWTNRGRGARQATAVVVRPAEWYEDVERLARAQGALPYVVEGFVEIYEAVRRGHAVLLKREPCAVADGVTVFDAGSGAGDDGDRVVLDPAGWFRRPGGSDVVTVSRFDVRTARFVVQDPASAVGSIELTPKRLQRYVADPGRAVGIALGG